MLGTHGTDLAHATLPLPGEKSGTCAIPQLQTDPAAAGRSMEDMEDSMAMGIMIMIYIYMYR